MTLAELSPGFADPVHGAQQTFRGLLDAMSRPGRVVALSAGLEPPAPLGVAAAAVLLTLLDAETSVYLGGALRNGTAAEWLRFHTGVRSPALHEAAAFTVLRAADLPSPAWSTLDAGTDEQPQRGATLVVEVPSLEADPAGPALALRGPGIEALHRLAAGGLSRGFWLERIAMQAQAPRGIDLVLTCGTHITAVPRTTRIHLEG